MSDDLDYGKTITALSAGQKVFSRYTLVRVLGRGGMGVVWLARDEELSREVALKFLPETVALDRGAVADLKRETRRSLELTHPHIVRIYDFVSDAHTACISMEYVAGNTLSALRANQPNGHFEVADLTEWVKQLCEALDYAHSKAKVVHRDLKPANLMVDARGDLKIADFGISSSVADTVSQMSDSLGASGTPVYMSPQQMLGEKPAPTDDVYSLGATLYELLTGKPPFYSGRIETQIMQKVPPSLAERRREMDSTGNPIPQFWEETIAACLAKEAKDRPQSVGAVAQRLCMIKPAPSPKPEEPESGSVRYNTGGSEPSVDLPAKLTDKIDGAIRETVGSGSMRAGVYAAGLGLFAVFALFVGVRMVMDGNYGLASIVLPVASGLALVAWRYYCLGLLLADRKEAAESPIVKAGTKTGSQGAITNVVVGLVLIALSTALTFGGERWARSQGGGSYTVFVGLGVVGCWRLLKGLFQLASAKTDRLAGPRYAYWAGLTIPALVFVGLIYYFGIDAPRRARQEKFREEQAQVEKRRQVNEDRRQEGIAKISKAKSLVDQFSNGTVAQVEGSFAILDTLDETNLNLHLEAIGPNLSLKGDSLLSWSPNGTASEIGAMIERLRSDERWANLGVGSIKVDANNSGPKNGVLSWQIHGIRERPGATKSLPKRAAAGAIPKERRYLLTAKLAMLAANQLTRDTEDLAIETRLIDPVRQQENLKLFYRAESESRVKLTELQQLAEIKETRADPYRTVPFSVSVEGAYSNLMQFLDVLQMLKCLRILDFSITDGSPRLATAQHPGSLFETAKNDFWRNYVAGLVRTSGPEYVRIESDKRNFLEALQKITVRLSETLRKVRAFPRAGKNSEVHQAIVEARDRIAKNLDGIEQLRAAVERQQRRGSTEAGLRSAGEAGGLSSLEAQWQAAFVEHGANHAITQQRADALRDFLNRVVFDETKQRELNKIGLRNALIECTRVMDMSLSRMNSAGVFDEEFDGLWAKRPREMGEAPDRIRGPQDGEGWTVADLQLDLVPILAGTFRMGGEGQFSGQPYTQVTLSHPFWLGATEVTQGQWSALMGGNPSNFKGDALPVENVSWTEAMEFCQKLTERERAARRLPDGYVYTLPTEAQWEYACRAGTTGEHAGALSAMAWYVQNSGNTTHAVGTKQANAWGLSDMHGNVLEWCADWYVNNLPGGSVTDPTGAGSGAFRVVRGGGWGHAALHCRSAFRVRFEPVFRHNNLGFRLALSSVP